MSDKSGVIINEHKRVGRNSLCHCGCGLKVKHCRSKQQYLAEQKEKEADLVRRQQAAEQAKLQRNYIAVLEANESSLPSARRLSTALMTLALLSLR